MENFKTESKYLKLCYEFRVVIRCMKAAFYRPDYQKILMCPLIKRLFICFKTCGLAFETISRAFETLGRAFKTLRGAFKTLGCAFEGLREN